MRLSEKNKGDTQGGLKIACKRGSFTFVCTIFRGLGQQGYYMWSWGLCGVNYPTGTNGGNMQAFISAHRDITTEERGIVRLERYLKQQKLS